MNRFTMRSLVLVWIVVVASFAFPATVIHAASPSGRYVTVRPTFGRYTYPLRTYLTSQEIDVVRNMQRAVDEALYGPEAIPFHVTWHIEKSALASRTLFLSRRAWDVERRMLEYYDLVDGWNVEIIVARSQRYINRKLREVKCYPNLESTNGVIVMGAALCNRRVIVVNLTGYFFLKYPGQAITSTMESRPEPPIGDTSYVFVNRNLSGLAHEWAHVRRAQGARGNVRLDETYWLAEGWAQMMAGIGRVRAFTSRMTYLEYHVTALRKSYDWASRCTGGLRSYRMVTVPPPQCVYYLGSLAVELLIAKHGGIIQMLRVFRLENGLGSFTAAFKTVYGFTLEEFEREADAYINRIRSVA